MNEWGSRTSPSLRLEARKRRGEEQEREGEREGLGEENKLMSNAISFALTQSLCLWLISIHFSSMVDDNDVSSKSIGNFLFCFNQFESMIFFAMLSNGDIRCRCIINLFLFFDCLIHLESFNWTRKIFKAYQLSEEKNFGLHHQALFIFMTVKSNRFTLPSMKCHSNMLVDSCVSSSCICSIVYRMFRRKKEKTPRMKIACRSSFEQMYLLNSLFRTGSE